MTVAFLSCSFTQLSSYRDYSISTFISAFAILTVYAVLTSSALLSSIAFIAFIALFALLSFVTFVTLFAFQFSVLDFIIDILNCISQFFIIFYQFIFYFRNLPYCQVTGTLTALNVVFMTATIIVFM